MKKKLLIGLIIFFLLVIAAGYGVGSYFVDYALSPYSDSADRNVEEIEASDSDKDIIAKNKEKEIIAASEFEKTTSSAEITSNDNLKLKGKYRKQENNSHKWTLLVHGYKSINSNMMSYALKYYENGYNVLLPNNRAHGDSEGKYIGMGWLDMDDLALWVDWIIKKDPQAEIIIHGVSMGGAATMMISGENLNNVVGYIEDCGYTSVWDIFASELEKRFSLPTFPVLDASNIVAQLKAGYEFKSASSLEQLKKCEKPMLFIHGGKDDFVPTKMVYEAYDAAKCEKDIYIVEEAGHAESKDFNPKAYWEAVFNFINTYINS